MATIYHFPSFYSLSSPKLSLSINFSSPLSHFNRRHNYNYSTIFASSSKKPRASRKLKSDEDLCSDIKDYLSIAGLPENHVPTMKELSLYGRQDLAYIVRRRGYKSIRQLLESSSTANLIESNVGTTTSSYISTEECTSTSGEDLDDEKKQKTEDQADVKRLSFLLHEKELELTQLKQQIEEEKLALSLLHGKAEQEISQADELVSDKETELQSAEEALSGLHKVEIKYAGEGETVELAGSFNGWQHKIPMEPRLSSIIVDPNESMKTRDWRAVLWLYPGVYEIKFVVDGDWRIDTGMESIHRQGVPNNILRVERSDRVHDN